MSLTRHGKLSYLQIPATEPPLLAQFYAEVFGWQVGGSPQHVSFKDGSGELIGAFVTGRHAADEPGMLPYVYVDSVDDALAAIEAHGGEIVKPPYPEGDLWVATFRDPEGNVVGIWHMGAR